MVNYYQRIALGNQFMEDSEQPLDVVGVQTN